MSKEFRAFLALPLAFALSIPVTMLGGVVLASIYKWFVYPVWNVPLITWKQAIGVMILASFLKIGLKLAGDDAADDDKILTRTTGKFLGPTFAYLIVWGIAAIWHLFI